MKKRLIIFFAIIFTPLSLFLLLYLTRTTQKEIAESTEILSNDQGLPAFATGNCNLNTDCFPTGCSSHVCANHEVVTTCEVIDFPEKETYTCGCKENRCVWYR